jgi:hypothetical protein
VVLVSLMGMPLPPHRDVVDLPEPVVGAAQGAGANRA